MARFVMGALFGAAVVLVGGAALGIHAAAEGGADETQEQEMSPGTESPDADAVSPTPEPAYGIWDRLAICESSGNWHREGRTYSGGLQFDLPTWLSYGGGAYAPRASLATRGQQILVAERLRAARGYQPWPVCSRVVGLR